MLSFLSKKIPYTYSFRKQLLIAIILGFILAFIMIFLRPFDTDQFESNHRSLILFGFGALLSIIYLINVRIENFWYNYKKWTVKHEIISFLSFIIISSILIHFYNQVFLNDFFNYEYERYEYIKHGLWFFQHSVMPIILILLPFYVYFRNKFGEIITSKSLSEIEFSGINKGEKMLIEKKSVLFIKASENYVEIFYKKNNTLEHEILRNTLTVINKQAPFLLQCHRSYLVNISAIKIIVGNSQNAKIKFYYGDLEIPLSKSYYKTIKSTFDV